MLSGSRFSPRRLKAMAKLPLEHAAEVGDIGKLTGRVHDCGVGVLVGEKTAGTASLEGLVALCENHSSSFEASQVEEMVFYFDVFHDGQCNFEIEPALLGRIARLGATFAISCYQESELVEEAVKRTPTQK